MLEIETLHHVSLPVSDLERSKRFYADVLGLPEIPRPPFNFPGAWFQAGDRFLHLIVDEHPTFRVGKPLDSRDVHFAIRVRSFRGALAHLHDLGYTPDAVDEFKKTKESLQATAGFPQVYVLDPDRNVVEINAAVLD